MIQHIINHAYLDLDSTKFYCNITETLLKVVLFTRSPTLNCFDGQLKVALNTINQTNKSKVLSALELKQTPVMFS
jgi:hypothetical protein